MLNSSKERLIIFDTTLRDGEQSPGVSLNIDEKVEIARQLSILGVDVCEAGFPIASQGDFEAVKRIATEIGPIIQGRSNGPMVIAGLARATFGDIQRAYDAKAVAAVSFAKSLGCCDIEFSPEDAGRSDKSFLCEVLAAVIIAGATTLNIPDTVGYNLPEDYGHMIKYLIQNTVGSNSVIWSTHCHNDLGLATANTLSGIRNGARQVEVTINGIGERAGNTALEEVVMAIYTHPNAFPIYHSINTRQIVRTSHLVTLRTGMAVQPNKAIVGANAFAHESGIHQDGYLKNKATYEIMEPKVIGLEPRVLVLGKHSGRHAFKTRITEMILADASIDESKLFDAFEGLFQQFKTLADSKKTITEDDLRELVNSLKE